ncbi:amino acid transporter [Trichoderma arundinaceum]|uniref:Amino acid transporter n=1 Tax=Trichoderma arundinaceum TaxID=490622 RepID=A0A395NSL1_TRIAR|nr:amino acid transporter [Trichoderma arundinaceum]
MTSSAVSRNSPNTTPLDISQPLRRQFGIWDACALGVITGSAWPLFGGIIVTSLYNGGPPGVLYELIVIWLIYVAISACIAELVSAMPTSAGVYYWATITGGPRWGKVVGFYAGWYNCFAYIFATIATSSISAVQIIEMYSLFHPNYAYKGWHVLIAYFACSWIACACVLFGNQRLARINDVGLVLVVAGVIITVAVCAIMPATLKQEYNSNRSVWADWQNGTGYSSNGFVFLMGMLNGAFAFGVPDCISHIAEEVINPSSVIPKAIFAQVVIGFISTLVYLITIFYAATDLSAVINGTSLFPISVLYQQATGSVAGAFGLLLVVFLPSFWAVIGAYVTAGRMLWTLGRGNASPFADFIGRISSTYQNPLNATICVAVLNTLMGLIYLGSTTALNAFATSFVCLNLLSFLAAILPHLTSGRSRVPRGVFWMKGWWGNVVHAFACIYIVVFLVIFCFPYSQPITPSSMNYSSVVLVGLTIIITICWVWKQRQGYTGGTAEVVEASMDPTREDHSPIEILEDKHKAAA